MSRRGLFVLSAGLLSACAAPAPAAPATSGPSVTATRGTLDEIIAGAKREGSVSWAVSPELVEAAPEIQALVKAHYGVDIQVNSNGQTSYPEKASKAISELQAGAPASYDLLDLSDSSLTPMLPAKAAKLVDWSQYLPAITKEAVVNGALLITRDSFQQPAYNPTVIPPASAPKSYDDFLDPKWKGKLTVINSLTNWVWLAQPGLWGEQKLMDYMTKLFAQQPALDRFAGMLSRLLSGEYPIATGLDSGTLGLAQRKGQPIAPVPASPVRNAKYGVVVAENASHPNAAILTSLVQVTPEGQAIIDRVTATTAAWIPGTPASKFIVENQVVAQDLAFLAANQDRIGKQLDQLSRS